MQNRFWYLLSKKLSSNATDAELEELEALQEAHPDWNQQVTPLINIWLQSAPAKDAHPDLDRHLTRMAGMGYEMTPAATLEEIDGEDIPQRMVSGRKKWWIGAAAAAVITTVGLFLVLGEGKKAPSSDLAAAKKNEVVTASGTRHKITLPDSSHVWLNAESKLEYNDGFGTTHREITLDGEAYFDVVKNKALPFIIQTKSIRIKVTGTAFNVKAYHTEKTSETSIIRGSVEVTVKARPSELYVLKPNEKLVIRDEDSLAEAKKSGELKTGIKDASKPMVQLGHINYIENEADSSVRETSWVFNRLVFQDEPFAEMVGKMERWYGVTIKLENERLANTRITYQIRNETVAQALRNLQYVARFHYTINGKEIAITK